MLSNRYEEHRPWGSFDLLTEDELTTVKFLNVLPLMRLSDQRHAKRSEYWIVLEGAGSVILNGEEKPVSQGDEVEVPVGMWHRLVGGEKGMRVLEISFGTFEEDDIERRDDDFGRK